MPSVIDKLFKTRREKTIFYVVLLVAFGSLFFNQVIYPVMTSWVNTSSKLSIKKSDLNKVDDLLKNEVKIQSDYDQYQKIIRLKDPNKRPEDTLLLQADEIQKQANIRFTRMDPVMSKKVTKSKYWSYTLQVMFDGDLNTLGRFMQALQERGLYIDFFQISPKAKSAKNPTLQMTVRMGKMISKDEDETK